MGMIIPLVGLIAFIAMMFVGVTEPEEHFKKVMAEEFADVPTVSGEAANKVSDQGSVEMKAGVAAAPEEGEDAKPETKVAAE